MIWSELVEIARPLGCEKQLEAMARRADGDVCVVALVGEFSRGKSSLLNALVGRDLLPVDVRPTSAGVVTLEHGSEPRALLHTESGVVPLAVDRGALAAVQTQETGGAHDGETTDWVEVRLPLPDELRGLRLIDTPGVNDLGETAPEIVYRLLPLVDLVVYVLEAPAGLTRSEVGFLAEQRQRAPDVPALVFFNKVDRLDVDDPEEIGEVHEELTEQIADAVGRVDVLFGASASAHEDLLPALRVRVREAIGGRRERLLREARFLLAAAIARERAVAAEEEDTARKMLEHLADVGDALAPAFASFRGHIRSQGDGPLRAMLNKSLEGWRESTRRDLESQIAMAGDLGAFAEHGLLSAIERSARSWCDRHVPQIRQYLQRHGRMALSEAHRLFGGVGLRFDPDAVFLSVDTGRDDTSVTPSSAGSVGTLERYGVAAAGSVLAGLVATPLSVVGFVAGLALAERVRTERQEGAREELHSVLPGLLAHSAQRMQESVLAAASDRFRRLDGALEASMRRQVDAARASLEGVAAQAAENADAREERRALLVRLEGRLRASG